MGHPVAEVPLQDIDQKESPEAEHTENVKDAPQEDLIYDDAEHEPDLRKATWLALGAMFLLNLVVTMAVNTPPVVLTYIAAATNGQAVQSWIPGAVTLPQAVLAPVLASVADLFQIRKSVLMGCVVIAFVGSAIVPGSQTVYRLIAGQVLIGVGCSSIALGYSIPSEILPRKWRAAGQAGINMGSACGVFIGPLTIGRLTSLDEANGWRYFWWMQMGLWGLAGAGILLGYRPPPRHTRFDHLNFAGKLARIDWPGFAMLTAGLTLFLTGITFGGNTYGWNDAHSIAPICVGLAFLITFAIYEWKFTTNGLLSHALFQHGKDGGRPFGIAIWLFFVEGFALFAFVLVYPLVTSAVFESDPFKGAARQMPFWVAAALTTFIWATISIRLRRIREPLACAFLFLVAGYGFHRVVWDRGYWGFGGIIVLLVAATQLAVPHAYITTASAIGVSGRALAAAVGAAIYVAVLSSRLEADLPGALAKAAAQGGLPLSSIPAFVMAIATGNVAALPSIPGITPAIIDAGVAAFKQTFCNSARIVFVIAAPIGLLGVALCFFMGLQRDVMDYVVEAPVENLQPKIKGTAGEA